MTRYGGQASIRSELGTAIGQMQMNDLVSTDVVPCATLAGFRVTTVVVVVLLVVMVTAASIQDRDGGQSILERLHGALHSVRHIFADGGYQGALAGLAKRSWGIVVEVVKKPAEQIGFAVLPRRWVVERTFSWLLRWRRLVRDYERLPKTHEAMVHIAMIGLMLNRLAPPPGPKPWTTKKRRK